jgi:hypothetical protein
MRSTDTNDDLRKFQDNWRMAKGLVIYTKLFNLRATFRILILFLAVNYGFVFVEKITKTVSLEISLKREQSRYYDD